MQSSISRVDPTNEAQAIAWDGAEGAYWADHSQQFDDALRHYQAAFQAAAAISPTDRILDVGRGNGLTTREAARAAHAGAALGVDLSARMIEVASSAAHREGVANAEFLQADAQIHAFDRETFDVVISRTGAMFFGAPAAAFANLARALRPDGRLTLLTWQPPARNAWISTFTTVLAGRVLPPPPSDVASPFSLSDPSRIESLLTSTGLHDVQLEGLTRPMAYGRTVEEAHGFVLGLLGWMLEGRSPEERALASSALLETMRTYEGPEGVELPSAAWVVTARRI